jgi:GDP-4-dehydro-6-deoxy-D-mannose reductase
MRLLVTGIDGFVGSHLVDYLLGISGVELSGTIIGEEPSALLRVGKDRVVLHQVDLRKAEEIQGVLLAVRPERIIHLAGQAFVPASIDDPLGTISTNLNGTANLLEAARKMRDQTGCDPAILLVSTGEVYGPPGGDAGPVKEESPLRPATPYAASKAAADMLGQSYRAAYGMKVIVARPYNHAGPRQSPSFVCSDFGRRFAQFARGLAKPELRVGELRVRRDFTDVRDVVRAYWMILDQGSTHSVFNVCSGVTHEIGEIVRLLEQASGIKATITQDPERMRSYDLSVLPGSNARLVKTTGWSPSIPFHQTVRDVYAYWLAELDQG